MKITKKNGVVDIAKEIYKISKSKSYGQKKVRVWENKDEITLDDDFDEKSTLLITIDVDEIEAKNDDEGFENTKENILLCIEHYLLDIVDEYFEK
jgi:hypothetical protein